MMEARKKCVLFENLPRYTQHQKCEKPAVTADADAGAKSESAEYAAQPPTQCEVSALLKNSNCMPEAYHDGMLFGRLSPQQREAVMADADIPVCIVAGPGSGKTATLTARIIRLLRENCKPISALTFTKRAAEEMRHRIALEWRYFIENQQSSSKIAHGEGKRRPLVAEDSINASELHVGTLHSFCTLLLRSHGHLIGLSSSFKVAGDAREKHIVRDVLQEAMQNNRLDIAAAEKIKGMLIGSEVPNESSDEEETFSTRKEYFNSKRDQPIRDYIQPFRKFIDSLKRKSVCLEKVKRMDPTSYYLYCAYEEKLKQHHPPLMDYNDLIVNTLKLLETSEVARQQCRQQWPYIFCDEFQDTDELQLRILKYLYSEENRGGITVVGDDDQSIFGFRGGSPQVFGSFLRFFPHAEKYFLECNWRCSKNIVIVSQKLIEQNASYRLPKVMYTKNDEGEKVCLSVQSNPRNEAYYVIKTILQLKVQHCLRWKDFAILARTNNVLLELESLISDPAMMTQAVHSLLSSQQNKEKHAAVSSFSGFILPISSSAKLTQRDWVNSAECLDILGYCRLLVDESHDTSFLRVCNRPSRNVGAAALSELQSFGAPAPSTARAGSPLHDINSVSLEEKQTKLHTTGRVNRMSYFEAMKRLCETNHYTKNRVSSQIASLQKFSDLMRSLSKFASQEVSASSILLEIIRQTDYLMYLKKKHKKTQKSRVGANMETAGVTTNIKGTKKPAEDSTTLAAMDIEEVLMHCKGKFDALWGMTECGKAYTPNASQPTGLQCLLRFMKDLSYGLQTKFSKDCIALSTIHQSKGLEWPVVLLIRMNEGMLPLPSPAESKKTQEDVLAEERRLAYVAFTRALYRLLISCVLSDGSKQKTVPSRFLTECHLLKDTAPNAELKKTEYQNSVHESCLHEAFGSGKAASKGVLEGATKESSDAQVKAEHDPLVPLKINGDAGVPQVKFKGFSKASTLSLAAGEAGICENAVEYKGNCVATADTVLHAGRSVQAANGDGKDHAFSSTQENMYRMELYEELANHLDKWTGGHRTLESDEAVFQTAVGGGAVLEAGFESYDQTLKRQKLLFDDSNN